MLEPPPPLPPIPPSLENTLGAEKSVRKSVEPFNNKTMNLCYQ